MFTLLCAVQILNAQATLVREGRPATRIVVGENHGADSVAAALLQDFVLRISGAQLPIVPGSKPREGDVVITHLGAWGAEPRFGPDGFHISTENGSLQIIGGAGNGAPYAVVTILERWLGVRYWAAGECTVPRSADVSLPRFKLTENPVFSYRQCGSYSASEDPVYRLWHRLQDPREVFAGGYWVHTFDLLLPSAVYGKEHPEYYSFFRGRRNPGKASQWCLSNPEVFEIVAARVDSVFKVNPGKQIISVSQNDGNYTHCQCPECSRVDSLEGSPSGSLVRFMNRLAERFPDKQISTLAYLYSMQPPRVTRPLANVNIMLCSIDCDREVTFPENASGQDFMHALEGWAAISDNLFVWDYGINFDNYLSPFPNFHIIAPNMRTLRRNHVKMHHSQIAATRGGNFSELRPYMAAKLMWNPQADPDSLMRDFLKGYYGAASSYLYQYIKVMEGALLGSGERLWIYDSPVTFKDGILRPPLMRRYEAFFDRAEQAVAGDSVLLRRVRTARLPIQYSQLEILRATPGSDPGEMIRRLEAFEQRTTRLGVRVLNERDNTVAEYCTLYRERFMPRERKSLAAGAPVRFITPPAAPYAKLAETALTDGVFGGSTFVESWVGWEGTDASMVVDLGEVKSFTSVSTDFLHQLGAWILLPRGVTYSVSDDGTDFRPLGPCELAEDRSPQVKYVAVEHKSDTPVQARYIRIDVHGTIDCPGWHYGVGQPCWFFADEITVY
ncbi:MAG: DUF4838 domain-containing protein [Rikenellaceae bacterium]|nr:DUF4838 domain-containing protein [Rikenellaceae bacterium]